MSKEYIITDGKRFIKQNTSGRYAFTNNLLLADTWDSSSKAESVLYNSVPPNMRFKLYVAEFKDGVICGQETVSKQQIVDCRKSVENTKSDSYKLSKYSFEDDLELQQMICGFELVKEVLSKYANNHTHKQLEEKTMTMNLIVEDIKHYHGKKALSSRDGFRLNKLEDKAIVKRISAKNQLEISKKLIKHSPSIIDQISDICDTIDELRNQKYKPRVLIDLFENDNLDIEF